MDEKGTKIQAIVFNDVADTLQQSLQKDKTYLISTGLIKPVNPQFDSAHNRFELTFSSSTQVKELETNIDIAQLRLQFVSFNDLKHCVEDNGIIGMFDTVVITLWADLAKNEGNILSELADDKPIVVLSKAKVTRYGGLVSLSTRSTMTLHINPALPEVEALKLCHNANHESATPLRGLKLQNAERVNIEELIERPLNEFQDGVNSKYYKDLIQQYGLSYIFLVKIDQKSDRIGQRLIAEEVHKDADGVSLEGTKGVIDLENMTTDLQDEKTSFKNQKFKAIKVEKE
ncbi:hypothetical protein RJ639_026219 [Escallonia herrerae]|uniref:Uncharacterized protein n=1 Tax=Escallonia herrerae TaxID=1293975 RepID=A0AA88UX28_9ASTE|nr:hypothetical protein RJ639_026219 [Escallonia herrerae]